MTVLNAEETRLTRAADALSGWDVIVLAKLTQWERAPL